MSDEDQPILTGDVLAGRYRIDSVLGRGGMGIVFGATHQQLRHRVAIKVLRLDATKNSKALERFLREARAASSIRSEHVARVTDFGTLDSGAPFLVMEYLEGEDLSRTLLRRSKLEIATAIEYVLQACEALAEAHLGGVVHCDVKPANMHLSRRPDGSPLVKLLDFGISKVVDTDGDALTTDGITVRGSPYYMSPEQLRAAPDVDLRSDVWALGVVLFELVSGSQAFQAGTVPEVCARILSGNPSDLRSILRGAPPAFFSVITTCLAKSPAARFRDVGALATALAPFTSDEGRRSVVRITEILRDARSKSSRPITGSHDALPTDNGATIQVSSQPLAPEWEPLREDAVVQRDAATRTFGTVVSTSRREGRRSLGLSAVLFVVLAVGAAMAFFATRRIQAKSISGSATLEDSSSLPAGSSSSALSAASAAPYHSPETFVPPLPSTSNAPADAHSGVHSRSLSRPASLPASHREAGIAGDDCNSSWFIDSTGIKQYKAECL